MPWVEVYLVSTDDIMLQMGLMSLDGKRNSVEGKDKEHALKVGNYPDVILD